MIESPPPKTKPAHCSTTTSDTLGTPINCPTTLAANPKGPPIKPLAAKPAIPFALVSTLPKPPTLPTLLNMNQLD
jgi:hypothetical protein